LDHTTSTQDEAARKARLRDYRILDAPVEPPFDRIARLAALALDAPMAALSLVDAVQFHLAGRHGLEAVSVPRTASPCGIVVQAAMAMCVPDTLQDPRTCNLAVVTDAPFVRFYAGVPLLTPDGLIVGTLCVFDHVARPQASPSQIATLRELASLAVDELELRRAREALDEAPPADRPTPAHRSLYAAYVAKSEFLSSLSHELRTPLNAITGYAGLIAAADDTPAPAAEHAGEIMAAARHMLSLVNDILECSRLEAGQLPIAWQRVRLSAVTEEALRMVTVFATSRGVVLRRDAAWPEAEMRGDPVRMKQVLLNLLTNAIKFTPRGGTVALDLDREAGGEARITITDTGIGISEADLYKVLTPYGQVVASDGGQLEGTGLGLPIAKALVERQGGTLALTSKVGEGTIVRLTLPVMPPRQRG